ncbi:MAG: hypothetical protein ACHP93_02820 [Solirubrobacterales bacterium]
MSQRNVTRRKSAAAAVTVLAACIGIAACGGSSTGTSSQAAATTAASATSPGAGRGARFGALRECLQKDGITLPKRTPGQGPGGGGFLGGGAGPTLPKGVTRAQFEAALKKCGGNFLRRGRRLNSPARIQALTKFAACMRANGVSLPAPNTSGKGPIFNTKGLDTSSVKFRQADAKCASELKGAFAGRPPAGGPPPGGGEGAAPGGASG